MGRIAIPSMIDHKALHPEKSANQINYQKLAWRIAISGVSLGIGGAAIAAEATHFHGWGNDSVSSTLLSFLAGAALQNTAQVALQRDWSNREVTFLADYATPVFLTLSQVYLNKTDWAVPIFGILNGLGGACTTAFLHTLVTRRLSETDDTVPLVDSGSESEDLTKLRVTPLSYSNGRIVWSVAEALSGVALAAVASQIPHISFLKNYGVILAGDGFAQLCGEIWLKRIIALQRASGGAEDVWETPSQPRELKIYTSLTRVFLAVSHVLPGGTLVLGGAIQNPVGSALCYLLTGALTGGKRHVERARYTEVPEEHLLELKRPLQPLSNGEKVFKLAKWTFAILGVGGFIGLGIAGLNTNTGTFQNINPFDRAALATFGPFLYGSYAVAELVRRKFKENKESPLRSTSYFYTHYSQGIPLLGLYIMEIMRIGNQALEKDSYLQGIAGCIAYASLGAGIGLEASARSDFPEPRVFSALSAALIFKFFAAALTSRFNYVYHR
ncbi:MAG: hypothetical protein K1000chlam2_01366 [Chlamydiae bacterium]|nr:hypothetical protein [Chlamydiota bacterium]